METLVIAFDGMDKELIDRFELEHVCQKEYGKIDNSTGISKTYTSELFASFITGETHQAHGIRGLKAPDSEKNYRRVNRLIPDFLEEHVRGFHTLKQVMKQIFEYELKIPWKKDLKCSTIFDEVENSRAMFVPSYNPSPFWASEAGMKPLELGYTTKQTMDYWDDREYKYRKKMLLRELESDILEARPLLMCHFHRPDMFNHMYGDKELQKFDLNRLEKYYREMDEFAAKIKKIAVSGGYKRIIFMSDHGLPTSEGHNKNAFYSCNKELFGSSKPKITDFYSLLKNN